MRFAEPGAEPGYAARGPGERPVGVEAVGGEGTAGRGPANESGPAGPLPEQAAPLHPGTDAPALIELLRMALSEAAWEAFSRGSAIRRAGRPEFARNVCVALGNWLADGEEPMPEAVAVLVDALSDPEPLVRGHAAWALGRVGGAAAWSTLEAALASEGNPWIREELGFALGR